ncbi:type 1 glutamine amidotransferase [Variovorax guangxiensis]|uniref:type 1 glutamine amidotransferase n=1 Tax=Variovorax guangxiensis TaxID=1775474 RepID=UPI0028576A05|nr:type 1 glutamine amidotransferase [Variovorax guangxiensis]MDR6856123.1 GMP synthase-like glutamine amidotransferase [Variovorax guangxiensis]
MKPIAIFQHTEVGAPGTVPSILDALQLPWRIVRIVDGEPVPASADSFSGLVLMGGFMSVHDPLAWIAREIALIREAASLGVPVCGHCLGSQILATALGGSVRRNARPEIGWNPITVADTPTAQEWLGEAAGTQLLAFQWHGDTFELPPGAERIATSAHCENQAFVMNGRHLAMQSHLEMTPELVQLSVARNGSQMDRELHAGNPAVTSREQTLSDLRERTTAMKAILLRLYSRWAEGLSR